MARPLGTGVSWTRSVPLFLFGGFGRILSGPAARVSLLALAAVNVGWLFFHGVGYRQHGINGFSPDLVPAW